MSRHMHQMESVYTVQMLHIQLLILKHQLILLLLIPLLQESMELLQLLILYSAQHILLLDLFKLHWVILHSHQLAALHLLLESLMEHVHHLNLIELTSLEPFQPVQTLESQSMGSLLQKQQPLNLQPLQP